MVAPILNSNVIPLLTSYRYNCAILLNFLTWLQIICHFWMNIYMYYQVTRNIYSVDLVLKNDCLSWYLICPFSLSAFCMASTRLN